MLLAIIAQRDERIAELEDRLQSQTLAEFRAYRPVAMPTPSDEPEYDYLSDPTGMVVERISRDR
jgi:hypothetical protein